MPHSIGLLATADYVFVRFNKKVISSACFKGWVQCFSKQVVMNKCFLLNLKKNLPQICIVVFEK